MKENQSLETSLIIPKLEDIVNSKLANMPNFVKASNDPRFQIAKEGLSEVEETLCSYLLDEEEIEPWMFEHYVEKLMDQQKEETSIIKWRGGAMYPELPNELLESLNYFVSNEPDFFKQKTENNGRINTWIFWKFPEFNKHYGIFNQNNEYHHFFFGPALHSLDHPRFTIVVNRDPSATKIEFSLYPKYSETENIILEGNMKTPIMNEIYVLGESLRTYCFENLKEMK